MSKQDNKKKLMDDDFVGSLPPELQPPDPDSPRGRIMNAALESFSEFGFGSTTTRYIAEKANVNQAMIHYYFGSKKELFHTVVKNEIVKFFHSISRNLSDKNSALQVLCEFPVHTANQLYNNPVCTRLIVRELINDSGVIMEIVNELGDYGPREFARRLINILSIAKNNNELVNIKPEYILQFLLSLAYGSIVTTPMARVIMNFDPKDEKQWQERSSYFSELILRSLSISEKENEN